MLRLFFLVLASTFVGGTEAPQGSSSPIGLGVASAQMDAGYLADVRDLKVTEHHSASENLTDLSLALAPPAPAGAPGITLVVRARFRGQTVGADSSLEEISLRAHYRLHSDDRPRSRNAVDGSDKLSLHIDPQTSHGITLDFFPTSRGYVGFTAPGDEIPVAFFAVTPEDLRAIGYASDLTGEVIWTRFAFTPQEVDALQSFARRILPARPTLLAMAGAPPDVEPSVTDRRSELYWRERRRLIDTRLAQDQEAATVAIARILRLDKMLRREGEMFVPPYPPVYVAALKEMQRANDAVQYDVANLIPDFYAEGRRAGVPESWLRP